MPVVVVNSEFETLALVFHGAARLGVDPLLGGGWYAAWGHPGCPISRTARPRLEAEHPAVGARGRVGHSSCSSVGRPKDNLRRRFPVSRWTRADRRTSDTTQHGNAVGGIRLPELEAPVAEYRGTAVGTGLPPLFGAARPFTDDELKMLYPSPSTS